MAEKTKMTQAHATTGSQNSATAQRTGRGKVTGLTVASERGAAVSWSGE